MEEREEYQRTPNPRRRRRSQSQIFKEAYLPVIIGAVALVLILIFIFGAVSRSMERSRKDREASIAAAQSLAAEQRRLEEEAQDLLARAAASAEKYNYPEAIQILDSFSGNITNYSEMMQKRQEYETLLEQTTVIEDPSQVVHLSFRTLIADPERAFQKGGNLKKNYITVGEFEKILQQLYDNGYILVSPGDFLTLTENEDGSTSYEAKTLFLPAGKKPVMLTQAGVNYYRSMVDGDNDGKADGKGKGIASRLVLDGENKLKAELVKADGTTVTGDYDLVPVLETFLESHPDFSFNGARAVLAVTGYDGVLGYRTNSEVKSSDEAYYNQQVTEAKRVIAALQEAGYAFACHSYADVGYAQYSAAQVQSDIDKWMREVAPLVGETDIMVFGQAGEIASYTDAAYKALQNAGFRYFIATGERGNIRFQEDYVRQVRLVVTADNLKSHPEQFAGMFDPAAVLDPTRDGG